MVPDKLRFFDIRALMLYQEQGVYIYIDVNIENRSQLVWNT